MAGSAGLAVSYSVVIVSTISRRATSDAAVVTPCVVMCVAVVVASLLSVASRLSACTVLFAGAQLSRNRAVDSMRTGRYLTNRSFQS